MLVLLPLEHLGIRRSIEMPTGNETPPVYRWLGSLPDEGAVVELPLYPREQLRLHSLYMFYSTYHWKSVVFGKTSYYPPHVGYLAWELRHFPNRDTLSLLRRVGVSRIVVRPNLWREDERSEKIALLETFRPELLPKGRFPHLSGASHARYGFGDERVYEFTAGEGPADDWKAKREGRFGGMIEKIVEDFESGGKVITVKNALETTALTRPGLERQVSRKLVVGVGDRKAYRGHGFLAAEVELKLNPRQLAR